MNWRVYLVQNCPEITPPKAKYLVVFDFESDVRGFLINSNIHPILQKSHMRPCVADIPVATNKFLSHDSFINCSKLIKLDAGHLNDLKGHTCPKTRVNILKAVTACPVLSLAQKKVILEIPK
ncbi:MAG: hypothetical protein ABJK11_17250 [Balneola sp.]